MKKLLTNTTPDVVWVDEASDSAETRTKNRHKIRSQARNHVLRTSEQTKAKWKTRASTRGPLPSRELKSSADISPPHSISCLEVGESTIGSPNGARSSTSNDFNNQTPFRISDEESFVDGSVPEEIQHPADTITPPPTTAQGKQLCNNTSDLQIELRTTKIKKPECKLTTKGIDWIPLPPSPVEILGAGKWDPFLTYPIDITDDPSLHKILDLGN